MKRRPMRKTEEKSQRGDNQMNYNPYLYEKLVQAHQQELLREAEQQHLARLSLRSPSMIDTVVSRLRAFLVRPVSAKPAELDVRTATGKL
jgi:hypothetical protein